jgi:hypothetical protein
VQRRALWALAAVLGGLLLMASVAALAYPTDWQPHGIVPFALVTMAWRTVRLNPRRRFVSVFPLLNAGDWEIAPLLDAVRGYGA